MAGPSHVSVSHRVTEKRAPTDESIRLLREMEQAALDQVEKSFRVEANGFSCLVQFFSRPEFSENVFRVYFDLNGKKHKVDVTTNGYHKKEDIPKMILQAIAEEISRECIPDLAKVFNQNLTWL